MPDVLIRDVPRDDLDVLRSTAARLGISPQSYLRGVLQAQATHLRRQEALARTSSRLDGQPEVPEVERTGVLAAVGAESERRGQELAQRLEQPDRSRSS